MRAHLLNLWDALRTSYWFVPTLFAVGAVLLSWIMPTVDAAITDAQLRLPLWMRTTTETARVTLSALAGAMVAVTGTVFSITVVTLSLASQQFGSRLLRRFMYDLPTQLTLGAFLATGFYCLLVLRVVERQDGDTAILHLSVAAALMLAIMSMAMLIVFIHNVAMLIQAPHVVAAVACDLDDAIERVFPEKIGQPGDDDQRNAAAGRDQADRLGEDYLVIRSTHEGYIQAIDDPGWMHLARKHDVVMRMRSRPGDFIAVGTALADVWVPDDAGEFAGDELTKALNEAIIVGLHRTPRQDVKCAIEELVEVAVRALSPGINDPFTAINCIDRLGAAVGRFAERHFPSAYRCDHDGRLRVIACPISFADVLDAAFNQIRQYGRDSVAVTARLLEALASVAEHVQRAEDREAVKLHAEMIARHADAFSEEHDQQAIRERWEQLTKSLDPIPLSHRERAG